MSGRLATRFFIRSRRQGHDYDRQVTASRYDDHAAWYVGYTSRWELSSTACFAERPRRPTRARSWVWVGPAEPRARSTWCGGDGGRPLRQSARASQRHRAAASGGNPLRARRRCTDWWDGMAYDGVVCNMALMDIDDFHAALRTVASVLRPSGWFNLSLLHPASRATQVSTPCRAGLPTAATRLRDGGPPVGRRARSCRFSPSHAVDIPERRAVRRA